MTQDDVGALKVVTRTFDPKIAIKHTLDMANKLGVQTCTVVNGILVMCMPADDFERKVKAYSKVGDLIIKHNKEEQELEVKLLGELKDDPR